MVRASQVSDTDQAMLITDQGTLVRFKVAELSIIGRNTQGVRLINVSASELVVGMQRIEDLGDHAPVGDDEESEIDGPGILNQELVDDESAPESEPDTEESEPTNDDEE